MLTRRHVLLTFVALAAPVPAMASEAGGWSALAGGGVILVRHAIAPGTGDPAGFRLDDCTTQRNLDEAGRAQARRLGAAFQSRGIVVGQVLTSQWCRAVDTAALAFPGQGRVNAAFNSFFEDRKTEPRQTAAARAVIAAWTGPGALVGVTHQVNITALTGVVPASGEGVVVKASGDRLAVVGRIPF